MPPFVAYKTADLVTGFAFYLTPARRRAVLSNLGHVLPCHVPSEARSRAARVIFRSVGRYYVDLLRAPALDVASLRRQRAHEHGYEHLQDALAAGRGVIVATVHYGCPEMALQAARAWGLEFFVLMEPIEPPELAALFLRLRASHGHRFMPAGLAGIKEALRTLRRGGAVLLAVDRDIQGHGVPVPFFGAAVSLPTGAAELARLTGAPVVPAVSRRLADGSVLVVIERPVAMQNTDDRQRDGVENTERLIRRFEPYIRQDPGQWLVLERLWKSGKDRPADTD